MSRSPLFASVLFLVAACGLLAAQPPKDPPKEPAKETKEPTHDGKPLSEWVKQLVTPKEIEQLKAREALCEMGRGSDAVIERLFDMACEAGRNERTREPGFIAIVLGDIGPAAVPTLTQGLWGDDTSRSVSLRALSRIGADAQSAGPSIARLLANPERRTSRAIETLQAVGGHSAIPTLTKLLDDGDLEVRLEAAKALSRLGADSGPLVPVFSAALKVRNTSESAAGLLGELGPEAVLAIPTLVAEMPGADAPRAAVLVNTVGRIGPAAKDAVPALKKALADAKDKTTELQMATAVALWRIARDPEAAKLLRANLGKQSDSSFPELTLWRIDPGPDTVAALEAQLKSDKPEQVIAAAGVLGTKSKTAAPLLAKMVAHKEPRVRAEAVIALVRLGAQGKEALEALRGAAKDDNPQIAFWASVAVCRLDPKAETVAAVAGYLSDRDPLMRRDAAEILGFLGTAGKPAVGKLTLVAEDAEESVRLAALAALWRINHDAPTLALFTKLLRSTDPRIREQAVAELGITFGPDAKSAVPDLVKRLFDPFAAVRSAAAETLGRIGPNAKDAAPALLAVLDGDEPSFVQSAACEALGLIEPADKEAAATVLKKKLEHADPLTRTHAALALFLLTGDKAGEKIAERGLGYRTHQVRITAAEALWRMSKDERAVPLLVRALEESNLDGTGIENERYMAVRALGRIGSAGKPAVPELVKLLTHHDPMLAATAADALKAIDPGAAKKAGEK